MKQLIIVRKDLNMSHGKMAAQVAHASMAFLLEKIKINSAHIRTNDVLPAYERKDVPQHYRRQDLDDMAEKARQNGKYYAYFHKTDPSWLYGPVVEDEGPTFQDYKCSMILDEKLFNDWIMEGQTKIVCAAKTKEDLLRALDMAKELGIGAYPIYDECRTELSPEEDDGSTLTCIGFEPGDNDLVNQISRQYRLY